MNHSDGINDRDDKSSDIEILMTEPFVKIKHTDPLMLGYQEVRRKRN